MPEISGGGAPEMSEFNWIAEKLFGYKVDCDDPFYEKREGRGVGYGIEDWNLRQ